MFKLVSLTLSVIDVFRESANVRNPTIKRIGVITI